MSKIWRYVVRYDDGLAPCVENDICTLTYCKPGIQKHSMKDDWVVGFHDNKVGDAMLCYAMRVTEDPIPYASYWTDSRFRHRRDNIYQPVDGKLQWVPNRYRDHDDPENHVRDHKGVNALISTEYWYFDKDNTFSLFDHLEDGVVNRLWHRHKGQKYNGLIEGDFEQLLQLLDRQFPQNAKQVVSGARRKAC